MAGTLFLPHYGPCLSANRGRYHVTLENLPEVSFSRVHSLASNWCPCNLWNSIIRGALSAVNLYTDAFVSGFGMDPYEYTRHTCWYTSTCGVYLRELPYRYRAIYRMTTTSRHLKNIVDIDIDIYPNYRMIHMPTIVDTIPNTQVAKLPAFLLCECFVYQMRFLVFISENRAKYLS